MAFPDPPKTWSVGETLTAANFNAQIRDALREVMHVLAYKTADEFVDSGTTGTTLQNDDHLSWAIAANETWVVEWVIIHSGEGSAVPNIKIAFTLPTSCTMKLGTIWPNSGGTMTTHSWTASGTSRDLISPANTSPGITVIKGSIDNAGTAGTVQLQWAQNTSSLENETVYQDSYVMGRLRV